MTLGLQLTCPGIEGMRDFKEAARQSSNHRGMPPRALQTFLLLAGMPD